MMRELRNSESVPVSEVPLLAPAEFRRELAAALGAGGRLCALFRHDGRLWAALAREEQGLLGALSGEESASYPALTPEFPAVHLFERELFEDGGPRPEGHPWLKPVRAGGGDFFRVAGAQVHEVAVGPVHAGIIEPGHFRFSCHGEEVLHLEIGLGYQRRGAEGLLAGGPNPRSIHVAETVSGDATVAHATAYAQLVEPLAGLRVPARGLALRGVALELERLANHAGDLGALAGDVGYLPTASYCGRLRGDFLNMTALLCGSRFGRGFIRPGGVAFDAEDGRRDEILGRLDGAMEDLTGAVGLLWERSSVMSRFEGAGILSRETALALGLVGPAARASGVERDARRDFPAGIFRYAQIPLSTAQSGDVFARAFVRWLEAQRSAAFVADQLRALPGGPHRSPAEPGTPASGAPRPDRFCVSLVEGWRGEVCHAALTDSAGRFARYKIVDPSFHNWTGLALAMRGQPISDFPLCNKSFNLSYCGHDL